MKTTLSNMSQSAKQILFQIIIICFSFFSSNKIMAQADTKDPSFGVMGVVKYDFDDVISIKKMLIQPDNKIIVAGIKGEFPEIDFILARFHQNGSIDSSFGEDGIVLTSFTNIDILTDIALFPDGSIIALGYIETDPTIDAAIAMYDENGQLKNSFDSDGLQTLDLLYNDKPRALIINDDNTVTVTGNSGLIGETVFLYKINADGTPVTTFGTDGLALTEDLGWDPFIMDAALQEDGKIVLTGETDLSGALLVLRFTTAGVLDNTFNGDGIFTLPGLDGIIGRSVSIRDDGKIVIVGNEETLLSIRLLSDGTPDNTFSDDGIQIIETSLDDLRFTEHIILPDNSFVTVGTAYSKFQLVAINENGTPNTNFDDDGILDETSEPLLTEAYTVQLQADGKILVGGNFDSSLCLIRYAACSAYFELTPDAEPHIWTALNYSFGAPDLTYLWDWNDGTFSDAAYPSHTYATEGFYTICLTITDANGCTSTYCDSSVYLYKMDEAATMITVNVKSPIIDGIPNVIENSVAVVPNPFNDHLSLTWNNPTSEGLNLYLYDMHGRIVLTQTVYAALNNIPVHNLSTGIYFLKISGKGFEQNITLVHQED